MTEKEANALQDPNITFFLLPTPKLLQMISTNEHPYIKTLPQPIKEQFLLGNGWCLSTQMVKDFKDSKLDEKNMFLLNLGEIRVFGAEEVIIKSALNNRW